MTTAVAIFTSEHRAVQFTTKNGAVHSITPEGALFKGGAALNGLKDEAVLSALAKAVNGRYVAATDVLEAAFPAVGKSCRSLLGDPCANKTNFMALLGGIERAAEPAKGWSKKQNVARSLVKSLRDIPALRVEPSEAYTIDA